MVRKPWWQEQVAPSHSVRKQREGLEPPALVKLFWKHSLTYPDECFVAILIP